MTDNKTHPKYDPAAIAPVILEVAVELHPQRLTIRELMRTVVNLNDNKEVEAATQAISDLRQSGLFSYRDDDVLVEPTPAALHVIRPTLLMPEDTGQIEDAWWAALVVGVLHPVQVEIIEALRCIDCPLSVGDLAFIFDEEHCWAQLAHHVRRLRKLGVVVYANTQTQKDPVTSPVCLVKQRRDDAEPSDTRLPADPADQVAHALLMEILLLHPTHLTDEELILRITAREDGPEALMVKDFLQEFKRCGLVRAADEVISPTFSTIRTFEIIGG